ncbi:MAG: zinc-ribbon domain-containing protein [Promethearchaeota archaeon]
MFCPHCGQKLIDTNQKFCQHCGAEVLTVSKTPDYTPERFQREPSTKIYYVPVKQQTQLQRGPPGKYSKTCLTGALVSIFIGIISLIIGYYYHAFFYFAHYSYFINLIVLIGFLLMRVGGLVLAVFSKVNSSKAQFLEPYNDTEKAGSIFAVFGMIINAIGIFLSLLGPWSIFSPPY